MPRIVIIDDHELFRAGLIAILSRESSFKITGEYSSFAPVRSLIPTLDADIVLVDISLKNESGIDVAKYIKNVNPALNTVILSSHKEEFYLINAIEAGVNGYIHKDITPEELISGLKKLMTEGRYYSSEVQSLLINNIYNKPQRGLPFLTKKEKEVIKYLMEGNSSKEIASILDVSPRTIETHRANVLNKFSLKNTNELIKMVVEHKIIF